MSNFVSRFGAAVPFSGIITGAYVVKISGIQYMCIAGSLKIDLSVGRRSQATLTLYTDNRTHFQQYQPITIFDQNGTLRFSGYLTSPKEQKPGSQKSLIQTITAIDHHFLADKRVIAKSYTNQTCGVIVTDILTNYLAAEGVKLASVFDGLLPSTTLYPGINQYPEGNIGTIPTVTFSYCTIAQALDALVTEASIAGDQYYWTIDENKNLWFQPYTSLNLPITIDGTFIDQVGTPCTVTRANPKYRNVEYITGGVAQTASMTEHYGGDTNSRTFTLGYAVFNLTTITVNGINQTVGLKGPNATGSQWYWAQGDPNITQDSGQTVLGTSDLLAVTYVGQYPIVVQLQDKARIATQAAIDGTSGIIEVVDEDKSIIDLNTAKQEVVQYVARYGVPGVSVQFTTPVDYGFRPGQQVAVNLPDHAINQQQMLIETVSISDQQDSYNLWYTVNCIQGPYDTTWVSFYSDLLNKQRPAVDIAVGIATNTPPTLITSTTQVFTATTPTPTATINATVNGGGGGGGGGGVGTPPYKLKLYQFSDDSNTDPDNLVANQYVSGTNILLYWTQLEPNSEGSFDWSPLETPLNHWASHGKNSILRVSVSGQVKWASPYSGQGTPSWVFSAGVQKINNSSAGGDGTIMPVYWDSTFLTKLTGFIQALANQYDGDSRLAGIQVAVGMGGECKTDTENYDKAKKLALMQSFGYTDQKWQQYIHNIVDLYCNYFKKTQLMMASDTDYIGGTSGYSQDDTINYILGKNTGSSSLWIQNDGLIVNQSIRSRLAYAFTQILAVQEQRQNTGKSGDTMKQDLDLAAGNSGDVSPASSGIFLVFKDDLNNSANQSLFAQYT